MANLSRVDMIEEIFTNVIPNQMTIYSNCWQTFIKCTGLGGGTKQ